MARVLKEDTTVRYYPRAIGARSALVAGALLVAALAGGADASTPQSSNDA